MVDKETVLRKLKAIWHKKIEVIPDEESFVTKIRLEGCDDRYRMVALLMELGIYRIGINRHEKWVGFDLREHKATGLWLYDKDGKVVG